MGRRRGEGGPLAGLLRTRTGAGTAVLCLVALLATVWPQGSAASSGNAGVQLQKTIDAATLTPVLALTLSVDKPQAIPGDTLTHSSRVSNTGGVLGLAGRFVATAHADTDATVVYYWDELQACLTGCGNGLGDPQWTALVAFVAAQPNYQPVQPPAVSSGLLLTATPIPASDVSYPQTGDPILGADIGPTASAAWTYQATVSLTPAQMAVLTDPNQVQHLRNVVHFEVQPRNSQAAQPFDDAPQFVNPLQAQTNATAATNVVVTVTLPSGRTVQFTSSTTPALASLAPGASVNLTTTYPVPVIAAKGTSETDAAYLARLAALDASTLRATVAATGSGPSGPVTVLAPPAAVTTEHLPIVTVTKAGPPAVDVGTTEVNPLTLQNTGGAPTGKLAVSDSVPSGGSGTVSGVPATLPPGSSSSGVQASFPVPTSQTPGNLTDTASLSWQDANANVYGPVSSSFTTLIRNNLFGATLTLTPSSAGPDVVGTLQTLQAALVDRNSRPIANQAVTFAVTGANPTSASATTDATGVAAFTYTGNNKGTDQVQATASSGTVNVQSNTATVGWVTPITTVSTTSVTGRFYFGGCGSFCANVANPPVFTQTFPTIDFNPPAGTVPNNITNVGVETRPFTDITTNALGVFTGSVAAQGNGHQAGVGDLFTFDAVFTGTYVVATAGDVTFNFYSDDGFIFGASGGATRVSGALTNPPPATPLQGYPIMGAFNTPTSPVANQVTVHFPAAGSYPYEVDYSECCGGQIALTMATSATGHGVPPAGNLTVTPVNVPTQSVGQPIRLTVAAMDASGQAIANLPLTMTVSGPNSQLVTGTTDASGTAVLAYTGTNPGTDLIIVGGSVSGAPAVSNTVAVTWAFGSGSSATQPPPVILNPSPADGTIVTKPTPITAQFTPPAGQTIASWSVSYQEQGGPLPPMTIASGSGAPPNPITTFDPTVLPNDTYAITISATASGGGTQSATTTVAVFGNLKLGRYVTTYQDLRVPVNGFQMQVRRVYDSFDKHVGDFGVGWHLDLANFRVSANRVLGAGGWTEYPISCVIGLCNWGFKTSVPHFVTVTFPDQHQEIFDFTPQGGAALLYFQGAAAFTARAGTGTTSKLEPLDAGISYDFAGNLTGTGGLYNPTRYRLTTHGGRVLILDTTIGLVSETDPNGNSLSIDSSGIHASTGSSLLFSRDSAGRITGIAGPSGQHLSYVYTSAGDLGSYTDAVANTSTYAYDSNHGLLTVTGPGAAKPLQTLRYDASGRLTDVIDGDGNDTRVTTLLTSNQQLVTDATGALTTIYTHNDRGDLVRVDHLSGGKTLTSTFTYDSDGRLLSVTDPLGHITSAAYDSAGNMTSFTDPAGNMTRYTSDALGNVTAITGPDGSALATIIYDSAGNLLTISDRGGNKTTYAYGAAGHVASRTDPDGRTTSYTFGANGLVSSATTAGVKAIYTSDASGRVTAATDANGHTTSLAYDANGNLLSQTDAAGHTRSWTYDGLSRLQSVTDPFGKSSTLTYDAAGRIVAISDRNGVIVSRTYDANGRLLTASASDGSAASFAYDGFGRMVSASTLADTLSFTYDDANHLVAQATGGPQPVNTIRYAYDAAGRKASVSGPDGTSAYGYDSFSDLTSLTDTAGGVFTFGYNAALQLTALQRPNGISDANTYDAAGQLLSRTSSHGSTILASNAYTYSAAGQRLNRTDPQNVATYQFDPVSQLLSVTNSSSSIPAEAYTYDPAGNRTSFGTTTLSYDAAGRQVRNGTTTYTYDTEGQRTSMTDGTGQVTRYTWNAFHQLSQVAPPNATPVQYRYDAFGRRVEVDQGSTITHFVYDKKTLRLQYAGNSLSASYTYIPDATAPLEVRQGGSPTYYLSDAQGSSIGLTDQSGSLVGTQRYDSFGRPLSNTGSVSTSLTFIGQQYDANTGLYFLNARYYDPQAGTFLSQDPLPNVNLYSYALNDPVDLSDPSGADGVEYGIQLERDIVMVNEFGEPQTEFVIQGPLRYTVQQIVRMPPNPFAAAGDTGTALALAVKILLVAIGQGQLSFAAVGIGALMVLIIAVIIFVLVCTAIDVGEVPANPGATPQVQAPNQGTGICPPTPPELR